MSQRKMYAALSKSLNKDKNSYLGGKISLGFQGVIVPNHIQLSLIIHKATYLESSGKFL